MPRRQDTSSARLGSGTKPPFSAVTRSVTSTSVEAPGGASGMECIYPVSAPMDRVTSDSVPVSERRRRPKPPVVTTMAGRSPMFGASKPKAWHDKSTKDRRSSGRSVPARALGSDQAARITRSG